MPHAAVHSLSYCQCTDCNSLEPVKYLILRKSSDLTWHYQYFQCFFHKRKPTIAFHTLRNAYLLKQKQNWKHKEIMPVLQTARQKPLWYLKGYFEFCMVFQNVYLFIPQFLTECKGSTELWFQRILVGKHWILVSICFKSTYANYCLCIFKKIWMADNHYLNRYHRIFSDFSKVIGATESSGSYLWSSGSWLSISI